MTKINRNYLFYIYPFAVLIFFFIVALKYLISPFYFGNCEPNIAIISYLFHIGEPVYSPVSGPEIYSFPYGPLLYAINGYIIAIAGAASITVSKIAGVFSGLFSLLFIYAGSRKCFSKKDSLFFVGFMAGIYLLYVQYSFGVRADPIILLLVSLEFWILGFRKKISDILATGVLLGIAVNLKIHSLLYFLPLLTLIYFRHGLKNVLISSGLSLLVAAAPFVLYNNASLFDYFAIVKLNSGITYSVLNIIANLIFAGFFIVLPIIWKNILCDHGSKENICEKDESRDNIWFKRVYSISVLFLFLIASKNGAGPHHFMPFIILLPLFFRNSCKKIIIDEGNLFFCLLIYIILILAAIFYRQAEFLRYFTDQSKIAKDVIMNLDNIMKKYEGKRIEMSFGGDDTLTFYRPLIAFDQKKIFINNVTAGILKENRLPMPEKTLKYLEAGEIDYFLVPSGGTPYEEIDTFPVSYQVYLLINRFPFISKRLKEKINGKITFAEFQLFDAKFRKTFKNNYFLKEKTRYFDIWTYNKSEKGNSIEEK